MKGILLFVFVSFLSMTSMAQQAESLFFGQCMVGVESQEEARELEATMRTNPNVRVVRIDYNTQRAFVLTNSIESLSKEQFVSWFVDYGDKIRCIQVGKHGVDMVAPYPFEDCND